MSIYQTIVDVTPLPLRRAIRSVFPISYNRRHARDAARLVNIGSAKVLVVGANTGEDCREFIALGAKEVHGLDVLENVGSAFPHQRVVYHRQSIECTDLPSQSFDLVYSVATMEHVPDIAAGYAEMARLVKPGGAVYSVASPLWFSPFGHHMAGLEQHPWIHIVFNEQQIADYVRKHAIDGISHNVPYMMNPDFFNRRKASEYAAATKNIGLRVKHNDLLRENEGLLSHPLGISALKLGLSKEELLPVTHRFIASSA